MPLPLFVVGAIKIGAVVLGVGGAAIGVRGAVKLKKAKEIGKAAQGRHKRAISRVNARRDQVSRRAKSYGRYLLSLKEGNSHGDVQSFGSTSEEDPNGHTENSFGCRNPSGNIGRVQATDT